jgi:hypothetical protein
MREVKRHRPSFGVWHFDTTFFVHHASLEEHALFLLERFEPIADKIVQLKGNSEYTVSLFWWHVGPAGFQIQSSILSRLAALSEWMSFTCWETVESE